LFNKQYEVLRELAQPGASSCMRISVKQNAFC